MKLIPKSLGLLFQSPKDYLYSLFNTSDEIVKVKPYNPETRKLAFKVINKLKKSSPKLNVYLVGSIGLGISGRGDIDLFATCDHKTFNKTIPNISAIFGDPKKVRKKFAEWNFVFKNHKVQLVLIDPNSRRFINQMKLFNLLKYNHYLLKRYEKLKMKLDGLPEEEYVIRRMYFFNQIASN